LVAPPVRWIPPLTLPGALQMALDEQLLEASLADGAGAATLRLYRWSRPTLSLGYHQRSLPPHWQGLVRDGLVDLVRRPSGGRAVLHAGDLTYALIWPAAAGTRRQAYARASGWLCRAFAELGLPLRFGRSAPSRERSSCFATSTQADLVHRNGAKRIGSAQLWRRGGLLQHGSILLNPPIELWRQVFGEDPPFVPALPIEMEELVPHLRRCAERCLPLAKGPVAFCTLPLSGVEWSRAAAGLGRYTVDWEEVAGVAPGSEAGRTSPEDTIERATSESRRPRG
jgi:lipoate-protein ligase A